MKCAATAEWNVMVFLNAKNNLEPFSFINFDQMARVGSTPEVNILVEMGRPRKHYSKAHGAWSKTLRFRIEKGMLPVEKSALLDLGAVDMGSGAALGDFVQWCRAMYPARREMLVIWDHGQGWRDPGLLSVGGGPAALRQFVSFRNRLIKKNGPSTTKPKPPDKKLHGGFRYCSIDEDTGDKLYNREIQDTLEPLAKTRKLDVIGFDACVMAMIETGYAMRRCGRVLVGSQELEPGRGWNYRRWLEKLVADPAGTGEGALGELVVKAYEEEYGNHDDTTLSSVDLSKISRLATSVNGLATALTDNLSSAFEAVHDARDQCRVYGAVAGLSSVDLKRVCDLVTEVATVKAVKTKAADVARGVEAAVRSTYASASRQHAFGSHGVSIYFPGSKHAFDSDPDRTGYLVTNKDYPVEFVQKNAWARFLQDYFVRVRY